jgi:endonuclease YncB( thermonuclease family)
MKSGKPGGLLSCSIALAIASLLATCPAARAEPPLLAGQASIVDGDTIDIHGTRIHLWGIDGPESSQLCRNADSDHYLCGAKAAVELSRFTAQKLVTCSPVSLDQYHRTVATCSAAARILAAGSSTMVLR